MQTLLPTKQVPLFAKGEVVTFEGFMKIYHEGKDNETKTDTSLLPKIVKGENLILKEIISTETFSRPPARYAEASLVKKMEVYWTMSRVLQCFH